MAITLTVTGRYFVLINATVSCKEGNATSKNAATVLSRKELNIGGEMFKSEVTPTLETFCFWHLELHSDAF